MLRSVANFPGRPAYTLRVKRVCPWCLEPLPKESADAPCPHCARPLGRDGELAARAARFQWVAAAEAATFRRLLAWGAGAAAVLALVMPFFHVLAVVLVPLTVAVHLVLVRLLLVRDAQRLLGPVRRLLSRWLLRFAFLWLGLPGYGAMTVPVAGVLVGAGTFAVLTTAAHTSTMVALERERAGRPLAWWEKTVPVVLAVLTVAVLVAAVALAVLFGWSVAAIVEKMQAP